MARIARVIIDLSLDREFDYSVPAELDASLFIGSRVSVPFGRSVSLGFVVGFVAESEWPDLKPIKSVISDKPYVSGPVLDLARWISEYYCSSLEQAVRTVLPGAVRKRGAGFKKRKTVRLMQDAGCRMQDEKITAKQQMVIDLLEKQKELPLNILIKELEITRAPVKVLEKKGLVEIVEADERRDPVKRNILPTQHLELSDEQQAALDLIRKTMAEVGEWGNGGAGDKSSNIVLLHGVTGSGKTEVYLQSIDEVIKQGKGAIVLVPEISLTPQTVERFYGRFGDRIAVLHSHLSEGERHDEWHRVMNGDADIVIGARSAVFAPIRNLGIIVVDEEHETSYKQEEAPRYNARDVAVMRGYMEQCPVVLGSATPSLESWINAITGKYRLSRLTRRVDDRKMPHMRVIDMRLETQRTGHVSVFSKDLLAAIEKRLERGEQVILFLNRRGYSTSLVCPMCGYVASCDNCSVSYTYHRSEEKLRCHICGASSSVPARCPGCSDPSFKYSGIGTQRVESILKKCFPHAVIQRMDADMTTRKEAYNEILGDFRSGRTQILIGTQMIAKGLHFPNVTLVGVIYADLSLHIPDFRAGERTFQLLAQVAGRAGRGDVPGEVIVQTYTPFHVAVQCVRSISYETFSDQELAARKELSYPPFSHLVCLTFRGKKESETEYCSATVAARLDKAFPTGVIVSPSAPAPLSRAKGYYRFQVMLRSGSVKKMTSVLRKVLAEFKLPKGVSCAVDVDAISML